MINLDGFLGLDGLIVDERLSMDFDIVKSKSYIFGDKFILITADVLNHHYVLPSLHTYRLLCSFHKFLIKNINDFISPIKGFLYFIDLRFK